MTMKFSANKIYITIFLRRIQKLQLFQMSTDVSVTLSTQTDHSAIFSYEYHGGR